MKKLFVWEEVFNDYTPGVAFAYAETVEEARELIAKKLAADNCCLDDELEKDPKVITDSEGFYLFGGG